jgi:muramoyltetrapeptide carboxypeptidase
MPVSPHLPPYIKHGDLIAIVSPSFAIEEKKLNDAVSIIEKRGYRVSLGSSVLKKEGPFAGTDAERLNDLQWATDNREVKAILFARGGYGMLRIMPDLNITSLRKNLKWFAGFSDITVLHSWFLRRINMASIHGEMPLNFSNPDKSAASVETLFSALEGRYTPVEWAYSGDRPVTAKGVITGGNLSLLYALTGTPGEVDLKGKILFIEEVGEQYYHVDRMLLSMKLAGRLKGLAALVAGGFSKMEETTAPWGRSIESIITEITSEYGYPLFFNFPAGHIPDNRAIYLGREAVIESSEGKSVLKYC